MSFEEMCKMWISCWPDTALPGKTFRTLQRSTAYKRLEDSLQWEDCWEMLIAAFHTMKKPQDVRKREVMTAYRQFSHRANVSIRAHNEAWDSLMLDLQRESIRMSLEVWWRHEFQSLWPECAKM